MTVFRKPKNGDTIRNENICVGHYKTSVAIVKNEMNELFFLYGNSDEVEIGTVVENAHITTVNSLKSSEREEIYKIFMEGEMNGEI